MMVMSNPCNENIQTMLPETKIPVMKAPRYVSKFHGRIENGTFELGASKELHATMGLPNGYNKPTPHTYLKRNSFLSKKEMCSNGNEEKSEKVKIKMKPDLPKKEDKPMMGLFTDQNYITKNAVDVILAKPKQFEEPRNWTQRAGFGQIPSYLKQKCKTKEQSSQEEKEQNRYEKECNEVRKLSCDAKLELLDHLKNKWEKINEAYQKLTFTLDTPTKKKRKENFESTLAQIEKDISFVERNKEIIIVH